MENFTISKSSLARDVFFICLIIYFMQGVFISNSSIVSKIALLLILIISFYYILKVLTIKSKQTPFVWTWFSFLLINFIGYLLTLDILAPEYSNQFKAILIGTLPFYTIYYLSRKNVITSYHLIIFFILMLLISIAQFYYNNVRILSLRVSDNTSVVNNVSYFFVLLMPYTFLFKKKLLSYISLFIILVFIIQGSKRGALIAGLMGVSVFIYREIFLIKSKHLIRNLILTTSALAFLSIYIYNYIINNEFLLNRLSQIEEGGSGRSTIYSNLLNNWYNSESIINFIYGYGFRSSVYYSGLGTLAHNDWLEALTNFGLLGFFSYLSLFLSLITVLLHKSYKPESKLIVLCITLIWLVMSLISIFYGSHLTVFMIILLAHVLGIKSSKYSQL